MHSGYKNSNTINYKMREIEVPERPALYVWEYLGGEILEKVSGLWACILCERCSETCFQKENCWAKELLPFRKEAGYEQGKEERLRQRQYGGEMGELMAPSRE